MEKSTINPMQPERLALVSPLLGADPFGSGVPIPSREGEAAMQDARRD
jgi:hypothetical protein